MLNATVGRLGDQTCQAIKISTNSSLMPCYLGFVNWVGSTQFGIEQLNLLDLDQTERSCEKLRNLLDLDQTERSCEELRNLLDLDQTERSCEELRNLLDLDKTERSCEKLRNFDNSNS